MRRLILSSAIASAVLLLTASTAAAFDDVQMKVETWSSPDGRGYVGVQAAGQWAVPAAEVVEVVTPYYSVWDLMGLAQPFCRHYWVFVHRTADDEIMNPAAPGSIVTCDDRPGIAIRPDGYGDLSLYLGVAVEPVSAPARTERTVSAELTLAWMDAIGGYLSAYVIHDSVRVDGWVVDFGDGTVRDYPREQSDQERLAVTHRYEEAGSFDATVTAHISGEAYAAFFTPAGAPIEKSSRSPSTSAPRDRISACRSSTCRRWSKSAPARPARWLTAGWWTPTPRVTSRCGGHAGSCASFSRARWS